MEKFYRISDFAEKVGKHTNTVDGWFKRLEEEKIHYVNRAGNEKAYDQQDLEIATFIKEKRDEKWSLEGIFNFLESPGSPFDARPFPKDESTNESYVMNIDALKKELRGEIEQMAKEMAATQIEEVKNHYEKVLNQLPNPYEERQRQINDLFTQRRVENQLEQEALELWEQKPESDRYKRVGFFRREEDRDKRDKHVKDYINKHYEDYLLKEYELKKGEE